MSSTMERSVIPSFNFEPDSMGMASWRDLFSMSGFGEGEGREIEKKEELQGMGLCLGGRRRLVAFIGFWKRFLCVYVFFLKKYYADVEICGSFKSFGYIYIETSC